MNEFVTKSESRTVTAHGIFNTITSGTSMTVPHIVGVASVLWQKDKSKSNDFIRELMTLTANQLGSEEQYGSGLVDLEYALSCYGDFSKNYVAHQEQLFYQKMIEPNESTVDTFECVNYVEGRWAQSGHESIVNYAVGGKTRLQKILYTYSFDSGVGTSSAKQCNSAEIALLKAGAVYPDKASGGFKGQGEWHGIYTENYMANYIYATRIALQGGNSSKANKVRGQKDNSYQRMKRLITSKKIGNITWEQFFSEKINNNKFESTKRNRQIFLYGMAIHAITDVYAHSTWVEDKSHPGVYYQLVHNGENSAVPNQAADKVGEYTDRYYCAQDAGYCVYANFCNQEEGGIEDFIPLKLYEGKFFLGNCRKYAMEVGSDVYSSSQIYQLFSKINIDVN